MLPQDLNCLLARRVPKEVKVLHLDHKDQALARTPTSLKEAYLTNHDNMASNNMRGASAKATLSPLTPQQEDLNSHHNKQGTRLNQRLDTETGLARSLKGLLSLGRYHSKAANLLPSADHKIKHLLRIAEQVLLARILVLLHLKVLLHHTTAVLPLVDFRKEVSRKVDQPRTFHPNRSLCSVCP